jgi:hypothetical protein
MTGTLPNVFIIESLRFSDEPRERFEGRILEKVLKLGEKESIYYYIRTRRELEKIAAKFGKSGFRYLHLSCHANTRGMATTLDRISFAELGKIFRPHLANRRVFLSACEMATRPLAEALLDSSGCYSVIGPSTDVAFGDAALLWASFPSDVPHGRIKNAARFDQALSAEHRGFVRRPHELLFKFSEGRSPHADSSEVVRLSLSSSGIQEKDLNVWGAKIYPM